MDCKVLDILLLTEEFGRSLRETLIYWITEVCRNLINTIVLHMIQLSKEFFYDLEIRNHAQKLR